MTALSPLFQEVFRATNEDAPLFVADHLSRIGYVSERGENYVYAEGSIPILLVAHTDIIHRRPPTDIYHDASRNVVWSPTGLGADDRSGVYAILTLLGQGYRPHVLFPDGEESGGIGACEAAVKLCPNVRCLIELDRAHGNDAVTYQCHSKSWNRYLQRRGWTLESGSYTDIVELMPAFGVAGVNLSIGYYNQHTTSEHLRLDELQRTIDRVAKMLRNPPRRAFRYHAYEPIYDTLALDLDSESDEWKREWQSWFYSDRSKEEEFRRDRWYSER